jgi:hypothetical protein
MVVDSPWRISSAIASPVAGAFRMPQALGPVATPATPDAAPISGSPSQGERRNSNWPELGKALHLAKVAGATLIAKFDRLSRNADFLLTLRDSGVRIVAVDMPEANDLTVGIMVLVAQQERATSSTARSR